MAVNFYKGRMHVGNRMRDWSDVWLELAVPKGDQASIDLNTDREYGFELYKGKFKTSGNDIREPDPSEVVWHSHFDVATFEAKTKQMREKIQKQFLSDAWLYLSARDPKKVKNLEKVLDQPNWPRWQSWFRLAKQYKRRQIRNLNHGIDDDDDDSDDDSAYDSDGDRPGPDGPIGPPPNRPSHTNRRRPRRDEGGGLDPKSKRSRLNRDGGQSRLNFDRPSSEYEMSGAIGTSPASFNRGGITENNHENEVFDPNPPDGVDNIINGNNLANIGSPSGERRRGNSRSASIPPFNAWNQNGSSGDSADSGRGTMPDDMDDIRRVEQYNDGIDDEEAFNRAVRASMEPGG